jgi:class 3 adenylate cyclase
MQHARGCGVSLSLESLLNIAARIAAHAEQGQILVSEDVVSHAASDDVRFRRVGPVALKNVSRDVVVHEAERA